LLNKTFGNPKAKHPTLELPTILSIL